jgi:hypothetical protein
MSASTGATFGSIEAIASMACSVAAPMTVAGRQTVDGTSQHGFVPGGWDDQLGEAGERNDPDASAGDLVLDELLGSVLCSGETIG